MSISRRGQPLTDDFVPHTAPRSEKSPYWAICTAVAERHHICVRSRSARGGNRVPVAPIGTPGRGRRGRWDRAWSRSAPKCGSALMAPRRSRPFAGVALLRFDQAHGERDRDELRLRVDVELVHRVA